MIPTNSNNWLINHTDTHINTDTNSSHIIKPGIGISIDIGTIPTLIATLILICIPIPSEDSLQFLADVTYQY